MAPLRGNKKRIAEKNDEGPSSVAGSSKEGPTDWWWVLAKIGAGHSLPPHLLDEFKSTFKVSRKTFEYICSLVKDHMMAKTHFAFTNGRTMSLHDLVALALVRLGSGNSLISIGDLFGAHHSTVSQVTWRFVEAMEEKALHHLQWPSTKREMTDIKRGFERISGLPNCCGAIDTTHITMLLTSNDREANVWLDHKQNHSMLLQAIVDPTLRFRDIVSGFPGRVSKSLLLKNSKIFHLCHSGERLNGNMVYLSEEDSKIREYIVGDSGFPLLPWLVTPYRGEDLPRDVMAFNKRLAKTHDMARRAFARLKEVWKMIQGDMWRPDRHKLPRFILVCCILHNIVIDIEGEEVCNGLPSHDPGYGVEVCGSVDAAGSILRDDLYMQCLHGLKMSS